ncbi:MAG: branched-chain amino acid ABC transporter permease [Acetobacteraceae bacterium]
MILNWESLTRGPMGVTNIPPLQVGTLALDSPQASYWVTLGALVMLALLQSRLLRSHLGRTFRAIRDDDVAARAYGISLDRYKAIGFGVAGFTAGISGGISAHLYSYINNETFTSTVSISALTMVILGGMGNVLGAILGAVALTALPELFRGTAEYRMLTAARRAGHGMTELWALRGGRPGGSAAWSRSTAST